jgi:holin-like protein
MAPMLHAAHTDALVASDPVKGPRRPVLSATSRIADLGTALLLVVQIAVLWLFNLASSAAVAWFHVPVPGNVVGLAILFALLCSGVVKTSWLEPAATLLIKHLPFFFIPITVGLMGLGPLFALDGVGIVLALVVSAAVGMATCGLTSQVLMHAQNAAKAGLLPEIDG